VEFYWQKTFTDSKNVVCTFMISYKYNILRCDRIMLWDGLLYGLVLISPRPPRYAALEGHPRWDTEVRSGGVPETLNKTKPLDR